MANLIGCVKNGNYFMELLDNGTKVRYNDLDFFKPEKPESLDIKICNRCNMGCPMCFENSTPYGELGNILNVPFFDTLLPYTEIAIGGGNPLVHTDLIPFLEQLKERKLIANITVNQYHFFDNVKLLSDLADEKLIYGLGVSLMNVNQKLINEVSKFPNAVIHVINGIVDVNDLKQLAHNGLKILILGYKEFRKGKDMYDNQGESIEKKKSELYDALPTIIEEGWFDVVSFDNLAIEQLDVKRLMDEKKWDEFYMGNDGQFTMYVDLVEKKFSKSSTSTERYNMLDDIKPMFDKVKEVS